MVLNLCPWLFSFINFQLIRLTASLGFEARYLIVSEIAVYPANRNTNNAVLRIAAMTCGMAPHRTGEVSSPSTVSSATCSLLTNARAVKQVSALLMLHRDLDLLYHTGLCVSSPSRQVAIRRSLLQDFEIRFSKPSNYL